MPLINRCGGGSSFAAVIQVTHRTNVICTCSNGTKTLTDSSTSTESTFKVNSKGTWTITAAYGGITETKAVEITADGQVVQVKLLVFYTYGISRDITNSSPAWARTDDAIGLSAIRSIYPLANGHSDFDNCYPWSGIQRETLLTGDVMVKIPKFWYRRYIEGNIEYIKIADKAYSGFSLHPAFNHGGVAKDYIYVSAYEASTSGGTYASVTGKAPASYMFLSDRTKVRTKGNGWEIMDIATFSALQMLILVEFATYDVQTAIGNGYCTDSTIETGNCDNMLNTSTDTPTGIPTQMAIGTGYAYGVIWRGIENLWGNASANLDGLLVKSQKPYICNNPSQYSDAITSNYVALSYTIAAATQYFITKLGLDGNYPWIMLPTEANGGSSNTYICDSLYCSSSSDVMAVCCGEGRSDIHSTGLFRTEIDTGRGGTDGIRLIYIPQEAAS